MKPETLERAIKIKEELEELESLRRITYIPYPQIVNDSDNRDDVNTAYFCKETLEKFKEVIRHFEKHILPKFISTVKHRFLIVRVEVLKNLQ